MRELQNVLERMLNNAKGSQLSQADLPFELFFSETSRKNEVLQSRPSLQKGSGKTIQELMEMRKKLLKNEERLLIIELLKTYNGNVSKVAREIGISRTTLYKKMKLYKVDE